MSIASKQYGLVKPKKPGQSALQTRPRVFCEESDPEDGGGDWVKNALKRESEKGLQKKQTKLEMERALAVDPTVYQYDEVYDKIEEKKAEDRKLKSMDKKPKYIQTLLKQAERRKKEQERRFERDVQREREAEGEQFKGKEAFVTSAYRAKLEEFHKMDEEEKHMERIEAIMDVSKQKDLSGFYRHLYRQTTGDSSVTEPGDTKIKEEPPDTKSGTPAKDPEKKTEVEQRRGSASNAGKSRLGGHSARQYRKRRASSSDGEEVKNGKRTVPVTSGDKNEHDSDDSSSSSESSTESSDSDEPSKNTVNNIGKSDNKASASHADAGNAEEQGKASVEEGKKDSEETKETKTAVPKINVWEKRTVGAVFEAALERYYARKAARLAG